MSVSLSSEVTEDTQSQSKNQTAGWRPPAGWSGVNGGISDTSAGVLAWGRADAVAISTARALWASKIGLDASRCISLEQTHSANIVTVERTHEGSGFCDPATRIPNADGMITNSRGTTLITSHADCAPVFLYHESTRSIGLVHSGWRGTLAGIASHAVECLQAEFAVPPQELRVAVGPMIGTRHYEVGEDMARSFLEKFGSSVIVNFGGRPHLDLFASIVVDLLRAGASQARFCPRPPDTYPDLRWSSYRRDGERSGGMLAYFKIV